VSDVQMIQGHFNGTGAQMYLQLGSIPYRIKIWNLEGDTAFYLEWSRDMVHSLECCEGIYRAEAATALDDLPFGYGIAPYRGGELLTSTNQPSIVNGNASVDFVEVDHKNYRYYTDTDAGIFGDAATEDIDTWTLDTAATPTGHFNADATGTYIGEGSTIRIIDDSNKHTYEACITADLSTAGKEDNEVTLSEAVPSGKVIYIGNKYGCKPTPIGKVSKMGVIIKEDNVCTAGVLCGYTALCPG